MTTPSIRGVAWPAGHGQALRAAILRGKTPFLHVLSTNAAARGLYEKMGFEPYRETVMRVISRR